MTKSRLIALELVAQVALALAIGLSVSIVLAGATLLLAGGTDASHASPEVPINAVAAHT
jgi:hypothetical protein